MNAARKRGRLNPAAADHPPAALMAAVAGMRRQSGKRGGGAPVQSSELEQVSEDAVREDRSYSWGGAQQALGLRQVRFALDQAGDLNVMDVRRG